MASKMGIGVGGDIIDADYTREVKVILRNHGKTDCSFKAGDPIAQLIVWFQPSILSTKSFATGDALAFRKCR